MRLSVGIFFLVVLCISGSFSSPFERDAGAFDACYDECGAPYGGDGMSDDDKIACIKGCCPLARSASRDVLVNSVRQDEEESEVDPIDVFVENYPQVFAWMSCAAEFPVYQEGIVACCENLN